MIRIDDATMLALTKLRTRKVRLIVTIVISGLLFSGLAGASYIVRGVISSASNFNKEGLGSRYIIQASAQQSFGFMNEASVVDRAVAIQKDIVARKKAAAKELDVPYEPANETQAYQDYNGPNGEKVRAIMPESVAGKQAIAEYLAAHPSPDQNSLAKVAKPYNSVNVFSSKQLPFDLGGAQLQVLKNGQESFKRDQQFKGDYSGGVDSFVNSWSIMSRELLKPFVLPGQNLQKGADGSIPIVIPRSAAEQIVGLKALPASASAKDRLERTKELRAKAPSTTFTVCYRNNTSASLVGSAITMQDEIEKNKNKKDYQKPDLVYGLPTTACGSVPIVRDVRAYDQKQEAAHQETFDQRFGKEPADQQMLTFRIVGIVPDPDFGNSISVGQIARGLITSSLGSGWFTPAEVTSDNPLVAKLFGQVPIFGGAPLYYAEFPSATQAHAFLDKENCDVDFSKLGSQDPMAFCAEKGKPFMLNAYGSNSIALESASKAFAKFFKIAALVVSVIAAIIMMGTVGRMIADSRRETAVFRAIGAKKMDIAQIYITYAIMLSLLVSFFAIVVGFIGASVANHIWSPEFTVQAINAFNATDLNKEFALYAFYPSDLLMLVGLSVLAGLLSAVFPLLRNLRRNPIRDMRDDT